MGGEFQGIIIIIIISSSSSSSSTMSRTREGITSLRNIGNSTLDDKAPGPGRPDFRNDAERTRQHLQMSVFL